VLREELKGSGVLVSLVSPGPTDTSAWDAVDPDSQQGFTRRAQMLRPADVAEAIVWIATRPAHVDVDWLRLGPGVSGER
jgi:3-hydroxy acid dehydrogenase/malonic semialdehyde reductase